MDINSIPLFKEDIDIAIIQKVLDTLPVFVCCRDLANHSFWISQKAANHFNVNSEKMAINLFWWKDVVFSEDISKVENHVEKLKNGHFSVVEYRIKDKDGAVRYIQETASPVKGGQGKVAFSTGNIEEIANSKMEALYRLNKETLNQEHFPQPQHSNQDGMLYFSQTATHKSQKEKLVKYMALHDYLTGLPNRKLLYSFLSYEITKALNRKKNMGVLFLNLDRFKIVNDTLDHAVGDLLLKEVTARLKSSVNKNDFIFRQSGDEFIILLAGADQKAASIKAKRILHSLATPFKIHHHTVFTTASIGISFLSEDGKTAETLIKQAEFAMHQAKKAGKNNYQLYFSSEYESTLTTLKMEADLYQSIERNELFVSYEPKVNLKTGAVNGFEATVYWQHPKKGIVSPALLFSLAEETGFAVRMGEWVLQQACKQNKEWQKKGYETTITVNVLARQLACPNLVQNIEFILKETDLEPKYLELEFTENVISDVDRTMVVFNQLKNLGVHISINDFGAGGSLLNYLTDLPVDKLIIDRSFIRELPYDRNEETIVKSLISMAHNLNLEVAAKGIETKEQLLFLQEHFCEEGQGTFFGKSLLAGKIEKKVSEIQDILKANGVSRQINEENWAKEFTERAQKEVQDTVRMQQGLTFKFKKINGQFIHTLCDGQLLTKLGLTPSHVLGRKLEDFFPAEAALKKTICYRKAWEKGEIVTYEGVVNETTYLAVLCPVKQGGKVIEVIGSGIDITTRKKVEEALQESESKYRLIAENMTDLICLLDNEGSVLYTSPSHEAVLGFPKEDFEKNKTMEKVHPEDIDFFYNKLEEIVKTKTPAHLEFRFQHAKGNWLLIECVGTPVIGENGDTEHIIIVGRDITEKRKAEDLLSKSEKLTVVGELAAGVAHEIRNPLTSIKGFVQLLQQGIIKEEFFTVIMDEFTRVEGIIKEFLNLAKPQEIQLKKSDLKKVLENVGTLLESEAHLKNVQIQQKIDPNIPLCMCDFNQLKQVFINLIKNSIEALPNGGLVSIEAKKEKTHILIKIVDNGIGINEERLRRLGEPFFSNKEKGTGLGLMLCLRIVREHKGAIHFKSKENEGTTVEVRLPLS